MASYAKPARKRSLLKLSSNQYVYCSVYNDYYIYLIQSFLIYTGDTQGVIHGQLFCTSKLNVVNCISNVDR